MNHFYDIAPFPGACLLVSDAQGQSRNAEVCKAVFEHGDKYALHLPPCSSIVSTELSISSNHVLILHVAVARDGASSSILSLSFDTVGLVGVENSSTLMTINLDAAFGLCEQYIELSLQAFAGRVGKFRLTSLRS